MIGFGIMFLGIVAVLATSPDLLFGWFDLIDLHVQTGPDLIEALDCAQSLARARAGL